MRAHATLRPLAAAGLLAGLASCVSFTWSRDRTFEPLPKGALDGLEPGRTPLAECLRRFGAPLYVWEYKVEGAALAWGSADEDAKRLSLSIPLDRFRPSFSYGRADAKLRGAVLFFDEDLVLEQVKQGWLRDLRREAQHSRPAPAPGESAGLTAPEGIKVP